MSEKLYYRAQKHWIIFSLPIIMLIIILIAFIMYSGKFKEPVELWYIVMLLPVFLLISNIITYLVTSLEVTNLRVIFKSGLLIRHFKDYQINRIEAVKVNQTIIGEMLGYGNLIIAGTGGTKNIFTNIRNPKIVRNHISAQIAKTHQK